MMIRHVGDLVHGPCDDDPVPLYCRASDCDKVLTPTNRSIDTPGHCAECGDFVWAYRPDASLPNDWYEIPEPIYDGRRIAGGPCEVCAASEMTIQRVGRQFWTAACLGQEWDERIIFGCKSLHPVRRKPRMEVILRSSPDVVVPTTSESEV